MDIFQLFSSNKFNTQSVLIHHFMLMSASKNDGMWQFFVLEGTSSMLIMFVSEFDNAKVDRIFNCFLFSHVDRNQ